MIDCAAYLDGRRVDAGDVAEAVRLVRSERRPGAFVWVGLHEPAAAELERLAGVFGLHPLAVEDAVHAHQRPKLERHGDTLFVVFKTLHHLDASPPVVRTGEIMVFLGEDFVVTVRHGEHCALGTVRRRLERSPDLLALGPAAVLHAVADRVVDGYLSVIDGVQQDLDEVEARVFATPRGNDVERIYHLKREIIEVKRAVTPLGQPMRSLVTRRVIPPRIREHLRDVEDHLTRVREQVASCDELATSILQAHLTQVTVGDNQDMRKISAWVAILAVPTAVSAIYGMNFEHMPELRWTFGYPLVLALMAMVCLLLYRGFRRNGWL